MLWIIISNRAGRERFLHKEGSLEFGRGPRRDVPRKVLRDPTVSGNQLLLEEPENGRVRLVNLSARVAIRLGDGREIAPGGELTVAPPTRLHVGDTLIEIEFADRVDSPSGLAQLRTIEPPVAMGSPSRTLAPRIGAWPAAEELTRWFESLVRVQRAAASSPDFFAQTARAVVELIGLDVGLVLLRQGSKWKIAGGFSPRNETHFKYSDFIVGTVAVERRTFYQEISSTETAPGDRARTSSLEGVAAVVASPILNDAQEVIGAVYGERRGEGRCPEITPLEAQLTQVLAGAVAAGLARVESEAQASRRRVQFEQFFTPDLVAALDRDAALLEGRERDVTVLFADIRGFSAVSERLSPRLTCELVRDVMEHLTARIMESSGVVVDYIGDGLLAMWNAPMEQPDHATLACQAALAMRDGLPELNRRWQDRLQGSLGVGIGLNSGLALVGNTGSHKKFKYGPLGHTVNLGSRVEGATKHLGVKILITGSTRERLGPEFATRRLCRARVVGIAGDVDLHELHAESASAEWQSRSESYEHALALYEAGEWSEACQALFPLVKRDEGVYDLPSLTLLGRAVECLKAPPSPFDPILEIKSK